MRKIKGKLKTLFLVLCPSPFSSKSPHHIIEKSNVAEVEIENVGLKVLEYSAAMYTTWDSTQLVSDSWDDEHNGADSDISMKVDALEADLLQSLQVTRRESWLE